MTDNVIQFRRKDATPPDNDRLLFSIDIYQGDRNGFHWIVISEDEATQPNAEQLSEYLGDMFIALNPQPPSIFQRLRTFFHQTFTPKQEPEND